MLEAKAYKGSLSSPYFMHVKHTLLAHYQESYILIVKLNKYYLQYFRFTGYARGSQKQGPPNYFITYFPS